MRDYPKWTKSTRNVGSIRMNNICLNAEFFLTDIPFQQQFRIDAITFALLTKHTDELINNTGVTVTTLDPGFHPGSKRNTN